jgi:hypothetical protein
LDGIKQHGAQLVQMHQMQSYLSRASSKNRCPDMYCLDGGAVTNAGVDIKRPASGVAAGARAAAAAAGAGSSHRELSGTIQEEHRVSFGTTPIEHRQPAHPAMHALSLRLRALQVRVVTYINVAHPCY